MSTKGRPWSRARDFGLGLLELGAFADIAADPGAQAHQDDRGDKGRAPAPGHELLVRHHRQQRHHPRGHEQPQRQADLRDRGVEAALVLGREFIGHQHGPAPFAADADALGHAQDQQQDRRGDADLVIGRQKPDQHGRPAHQQQRDDQHGLAPDTVAEMAKDDTAQRPGDKAHGKGGIGQQHRNRRVVGRKIQLVEDDARDDPVKEKVVPFDRRADEAGKDDLPDILFAAAAYAGAHGCDRHDILPDAATLFFFGGATGDSSSPMRAGCPAWRIESKHF